jgi:hypothetical protein
MFEAGGRYGCKKGEMKRVSLNFFPSVLTVFAIIAGPAMAHETPCRRHTSVEYAADNAHAPAARVRRHGRRPSFLGAEHVARAGVDGGMWSRTLA